MSPLDSPQRRESVNSIAGGIDSVATLEQLDKISELIPKEWLPAATVNAETSVRSVAE